MQGVTALSSPRSAMTGERGGWQEEELFPIAICLLLLISKPVAFIFAALLASVLCLPDLPCCFELLDSPIEGLPPGILFASKHPIGFGCTLKGSTVALMFAQFLMHSIQLGQLGEDPSFQLSCLKILWLADPMRCPLQRPIGLLGKIKIKGLRIAGKGPVDGQAAAVLLDQPGDLASTPDMPPVSIAIAVAVPNQKHRHVAVPGDPLKRLDEPAQVLGGIELSSPGKAGNGVNHQAPMPALLQHPGKEVEQASLVIPRDDRP